jgi:hypothetical protein
MLPQQPIFALRIEMTGRAGHVVVNDVPVFRNYDGLPATLQIPVNEWMLNGNNHFGVELILDEERVEPDASAKVTLVLRQNGTPKREGMILAEIRYVGAYSAERDDAWPPATSIVGPIGAGMLTRDRRLGLLKVSRPLESNVRLPRWRWSTSEPIPDNQEDFDELLLAYQGLWRLLNENRAYQLRPYLAEKTAELAAAYYLSEADALSMLEITDKHNGGAWALETPRWNELSMDLAGAGRLARLSYYNAATPLVYRGEDNMYHAFDFWWRKAKGKWVITR